MYTYVDFNMTTDRPYGGTLSSFIRERTVEYDLNFPSTPTVTYFTPKCPVFLYPLERSEPGKTERELEKGVETYDLRQGSLKIPTLDYDVHGTPVFVYVRRPSVSARVRDDLLGLGPRGQ